MYNTLYLGLRTNERPYILAAIHLAFANKFKIYDLKQIVNI